ncbi:MAG TPA: hypothetical protein VD772_05625, partial [Anseongella sp.]|nr:hypothetical protein [Anseongella sp.]
GRSMGLYDIGKETFRIIREADYFNSSYPVFAGGSIVFQSHFNGVGNIYSLDPLTGRTAQLSQARFAAAHPDYDREGNRLLFNDFVPEGMNVAGIDLDTLSAGPDTPFENTFENYSAPVTGAFPGKSLAADVPRREYEVKDYKGLGRTFNFHSISPSADINGDDNYILGLRLKSNNLLNTLSFQTGYNYNLSLSSGEYTAGIAYKKFYPVLSLDYINRKREAGIPGKGSSQSFSWREHEVELSAAVPLSFTKRNYLYGISLSSGSSYTTRYAPSNAPSGLIREIRFPLINRLSFNRQRIRSPRDLAPRAGQSLSLLHRSLPFDKQLNGELFAFRSLLYFPGVVKHHSFTLSYNRQWSEGQYRGLTEIPEIS